jgi:hypothetical protein
MIRDSSILREADRLAQDGELANSAAIRLLQMPHRAEELETVLRKHASVMTREALSKLTLGAFQPLPPGADHQRYEPIFDRHPLSGRKYTTASGTVVLNEVQYYNGRMVQFHGDCTNVARVNEALAGTGHRAMTLRHANGEETAIAQFWSHALSDTSLRPYNAMFIVAVAVPDDAPPHLASIRADESGASCVLPMLGGAFDARTATCQIAARLFFFRLLDTTQVAIEVGRERMGTDKRPGSIELTRRARQLTVSVKDGAGRGVARIGVFLTEDPAAYLAAIARAAQTAGMPFERLPRGTEYVYPAISRIGTGPIVPWEWRTDVVPRFQRAEPGMLVWDPRSEEGAILTEWGFRPEALGFIPNVRGVITGLPENGSARQPRVRVQDPRAVVMLRPMQR